MRKNKKGQMFVSLIIFTLAFIIFILSAPFVFEIIESQTGEMGTATKFFVRASLWIILLVFVAVFLRIISTGEGFFA